MKKVVFLFFMGLVLFTGCSVKRTEGLSHSEKFAAEYSVDEDNPFEYTTIDEILYIFEHGSGIVFFGDSDSEWCLICTEVLNEALVEQEVSLVYYYNPKDIQGKNTKEYQQLMKILEKNMEEEDSDGISSPDVYFIQDGKIMAHSNDTIPASDRLDEALINQNKKKLKKKYLELIAQYKNEKKCTNNC